MNKWPAYDVSCKTTGGHVLFHSCPHDQLLCGHLRSPLQPSHINDPWTSNQSINQWNQENTLHVPPVSCYTTTNTISWNCRFLHDGIGSLNESLRFPDYLYIYGNNRNYCHRFIKNKKNTSWLACLCRVLYQDLKHSWGHK